MTPFKTFSIIIIIFFAALGCTKDNDENPDSSTAIETIKVKANGKDWTGEGTYFIAFGNNPQLFSITARNDSSQFSIEIRANGAGKYSSIENGFYLSVPKKIIYKITSGSITIDEVTNKNLATGSLEFVAEDQKTGQKIKITEGRFDKVKGLGYW